MRHRERHTVCETIIAAVTSGSSSVGERGVRNVTCFIFVTPLTSQSERSEGT